MPQTAVGLIGIGQRFGRAHLRADGVGHILVAHFIHFDAALQQRDAILAGAETVALERRLRRRHGPVDIGRGAHGNPRANRCVGGIDDVQGSGHERVHPLAVEVKLEIFTHGYGLPWGMNAISRDRECSTRSAGEKYPVRQKRGQARPGAPHGTPSSDARFLQRPLRFLAAPLGIHHNHRYRHQSSVPGNRELAIKSRR